MALASGNDSLPLVVIAHDDPGTAEALRHAVETAAGWRVAVAGPGRAGLGAALATGPSVALVGCGVLGDLPTGSPVPVLAVGDDTRPADLRAALTAGAHGLVAWPDDVADLAAELARVSATARPRTVEESPSLVIAARGVQGGAGTTTLATHLAGAWARWGPAPVLLVDLAGGLAFRLDLVAGAWTWSALTSTATGVDGVSLADALAEPWPGLAVLPLPSLADGGPEPVPEPWIIQSVLEAARSVYRVVVVDLPPMGGPSVDAALGQADVLLAISRPESGGVRAIQTALDAWAGVHDPDTAGAVLTGARARAPVAIRDVRGALGERLWALIPAAPAELAAAAEDGVLLLDRPQLPAVQAMLSLANRVVPFPAAAVAR
ncbi:MAG TPA: cellulose synthase operon protein YhjQ/BcsQ [Actinomycetes bacterium]|jgi:cellulose biosynthesis protein BcsQ|nr:cellulose synthase operon protein YhjQ/BcsQ [Actinomycetes bacterium]